MAESATMFMSLNSFKSNYTSDEILDLNIHFKEMVTGKDGEPHVDNDNDKCHSEMVKLFLSVLLGMTGEKHTMVTGSTSENLRCVSENAQGDADIMFVSNFPTMSEETQNSTLVPLQEPGFYMLKHPDADKYPFLEQDGIKYINANSLRELEPIWFVEDIQLPFLIFEGFHHEYERAETKNVASTWNWRAEEVFKERLLHQNKHYFQILSESYSEHILPLLSVESRTNAEKVLGSLQKILAFLCLYGTSRAKEAISELESIGPEFESGFIAAILGYVREKETFKETYIKDENLCFFVKAYEYFERVTSRHFEESVPSFVTQTAHGSFDIVPSLSCSGFPAIANGWKTRTEGKSWPCPQTVKEILESGFHLVPKTSKLPGSDPTLSFRIAFSVAEKLLARSLTVFQKECYRVFKMYYYERLKRDPKVLTTYHLKTVFFWVLETTDSTIWTEENRAYCCMLLLNYLLTALLESNLPHYFIPQNNLFQYLNEADLKMDMYEVEKILDNPKVACGETIENIKHFYSNFSEKNQDTSNTILLDKFFVESNHLCDTSIEQLKNSKSQDLNMSEEMKINFLVFLTDPTNVEILKFGFDLIFARNSKAEFNDLFKRHAPLPSPLATLVQMLLPISDEITKKVLLPQARGGDKFRMRFYEIELIISVASKLKYETILYFPMLKSLFEKRGEEKISILKSLLKNQLKNEGLKLLSSFLTKHVLK